jgi:hypothetical protein
MERGIEMERWRDEEIERIKEFDMGRRRRNG